MIFQGIKTSIARKNPYFCDFPEGGPDPLSPGSGSAHGGYTGGVESHVSSELKAKTLMKLCGGVD